MINPFATQDHELYSNWEMLWPCVALVTLTTILGSAFGTGLAYIFGDL